MLKRNLLSLLALVCLPTWGQTTLADCLTACETNYPLAARRDLLRRTSDLSIANAAKGWLPQVSATAEASYQTQVTKFELNVPGVSVPSLAHDHEGVVVQVDQTLWDGGRIRTQQAVLRSQTAVQEAEVEVNLYALRARVIELYFAALVIDEQASLNALLQEQLGRDLDRVAARERNGTVGGADVDAVRVQLATARQQRAELDALRTTYTRALAALCGLSLADDAPLAMPAEPTARDAGRRPETALYAAQEAANAAERDALKAQLLPRLGVYVQGGFGKPGLNMLSTKFEPYAVGGVRLSWNFSSLYTRKNDLRKLDTSDHLIDVNRRVFAHNQNVDIVQKTGEAARYAALSEGDEEIVRLRQSIAAAARAALDNGTLDGTQYMQRLTDEYTARRQQALHRLQRLAALYQRENTQGK